jgi:hypothetical protein
VLCARQEQTLVALRADHVVHVGGLDKMTITKNMLLAAGSAKTSYNNYVADDEKAESEGPENPEVEGSVG